MTTSQSTTTAFNPEGFIGYEYKNVVVPKNLASVYSDYYPCFGWEVEDINRTYGSTTVFTFKRNRKLKNKMELNTYQRQFEDSVQNISHLEGSTTTRASIAAFTIGLLGTVFITLATFSFLRGSIMACIVLAIPGFLGWALAYVFYRKLSKKRQVQMKPEIEREYDSLYDSCEKAHALLA